MEKTTIIAIILGILVLVSTVQAIQLNHLKEKISDEQPMMGSSNNKAQVSTNNVQKRTTTLPNSLKNLPEMVGGC